MQRYAASKSLTIAHFIVQHPFERVDIYPPALWWRQWGLSSFTSVLLEEIVFTLQGDFFVFFNFPLPPSKSCAGLLMKTFVSTSQK